MLRQDLGLDVTLEAGPYGSFRVLVDDTVVVDAGSLAFLGVLPSLAEIRTQVAAHSTAAAPKGPELRSRDDG